MRRLVLVTPACNRNSFLYQPYIVAYSLSNREFFQGNKFILMFRGFPQRDPCILKILLSHPETFYEFIKYDFW